jgi:hypothetical protein
MSSHPSQHTRNTHILKRPIARLQLPVQFLQLLHDVVVAADTRQSSAHAISRATLAAPIARRHRARPMLVVVVRGRLCVITRHAAAQLRALRAARLAITRCAALVVPVVVAVMVVGVLAVVVVGVVGVRVAVELPVDARQAIRGRRRRLLERRLLHHHVADLAEGLRLARMVVVVVVMLAHCTRLLIMDVRWSSDASGGPTCKKFLCVTFFVFESCERNFLLAFVLTSRDLPTWGCVAAGCSIVCRVIPAPAPHAIDSLRWEI